MRDTPYFKDKDCKDVSCINVLVGKGAGEDEKAVGGGASESGGSRKIPEKVPGTQETP
jgi:hypothetical protein